MPEFAGQGGRRDGDDGALGMGQAVGPTLEKASRPSAPRIERAGQALPVTQCMQAARRPARPDEDPAQAEHRSARFLTGSWMTGHLLTPSSAQPAPLGHSPRWSVLLSASIVRSNSHIRQAIALALSWATAVDVAGPAQRATDLVGLEGWPR
jgi:hypothetical protein